MGQKVHPTGIRLGILKDWSSIWYAERGEYADQVNTDIAVRAFLRKNRASSSVSRIQLQRPAYDARVVIPLARPGIGLRRRD